MRANSLARKITKAGALPFGLGGGRREGDVVILLYHHVGIGDAEIDLPVATFERQLAELAGRHPVRSLDDALNGGRGGVVITFDDGFRDFHDHALPLLARYRVPVLLYLATGLVANGETSIASDDERLTWSQLEEAVQTGLVTIGSHTHSHIPLSGVTESEAEEEMRRSKELIEHRLGVACRHFAYPYAVGSQAADRAAARLFDTAARHAWRTNRRGRIDPHRLGRTPVLRSDGMLFFRAKVRGLLNGEGLLYRAFRRGPWGPM